MEGIEALRRVAPRVRGLAFDVDDTVTRGGRLEAAAFGAMWALCEAGVSLVAVTGRPLGWADVVARHWPVRAAVGENGAGWSWVDAEGRFQSRHHDPDDVRRAKARRLDEVRAAVAGRFPEVRVANDQRARRCDLAFDVGEETRVDAAGRDALAALLRDLGLRVTESSVHVHAIPGDWDKATGLTRAVADALDADADRDAWMYVGDSPNDEAAFAAFPLSVGVANVKEHAPDRFAALPRWVTTRDRGAGFAELAGVLLDARGRA